MRGSSRRAIRAIAVSALLGICFDTGSTELRDEPILPIPREHGQDVRKAALGERLFEDPRLSADDTVSCASCHRLGRNGADGLPRPVGIGGALGVVKSPTVYNSRFNLAQFWDGRAASLEEQVDGPVHNPVEMATTWPDVVAKLGRDPDYPARFGELYGDGITPANIKDAIATFERTLITPDSPFDRWLRGDEGALDPEARRGYRLFKGYGCVACHQGASVGGNMYQRMGAMGDYFAERGGPLTAADQGRFNVTGNAEDRHFFKVPSLRLAVRGAPYFHDASAETLPEAINAMARYQLGRSIEPPDVAAIGAFLKSLEGTHPRLGP